MPVCIRLLQLNSSYSWTLRIAEYAVHRIFWGSSLHPRHGTEFIAQGRRYTFYMAHVWVQGACMAAALSGPPASPPVLSGVTRWILPPDPVRHRHYVYQALAASGASSRVARLRTTIVPSASASPMNPIAVGSGTDATTSSPVTKP
jgi:hypothetical protein